ncbi:MAG: hypothetical protein DME65_01960 [Verrucomicrobia bacterium]|nr:MAG: hypothetical protein DME65_01960 [Verrucomicrobiota bacterium]
MRSGTTRWFGAARAISHIAAIATTCWVNLPGTALPEVSAAQQNLIDGKVTRDGVDLFYKIVGTTRGDYVLILSGGPGEDISSMQGIADELSKKYRCIMWEQRGTGRSKLQRYDPTTINLNAYLEDIEALR